VPEHTVIQRVLRGAATLVTIVGLLALAATPGLAGSSHATLSMVLLPPALTLSDTSFTRHGLVKVNFTTLDATATHALLTLSFSQPVVVTQVNASPNAGNCTPVDTSTATFTCDFGNVSPNTTLIDLVEFESPRVGTSLSVRATVSFAEGGNDTPGGPQGTKNDTLSAPPVDQPPSTIQLSADKAKADGDCASTFPASVGTLASSTVAQTTQVNYLAGLPFAGINLPCTPAAAGVRSLQQPYNTPLRLNQVWFVTLPYTPFTASELATALVMLFDLPSLTNANNFVLQEVVQASSFNANGFFPVPRCLSDGTIPPGGPLNFPTITFDSCVFHQQGFGHGGVQVTLKVRPFGDPEFDG
jgi:hypothetical protein